MSANNKNRLGKGLDALIPTEIDEFAPRSMPQELKLDDNRVLQVDRTKITPNPYQPRHEFGEEELNELADSIKVHGIVQPLVVTKEGDGWQLIAGERRLRAAGKAGLKEVPVIVRSFNKQEQLEVALLENVQRADLKPLELATAYQKLVDQFNMQINMIAARVGKSPPRISNTIRLLKLPREAKIALNQEKINEGHGRAILSVTDPVEQAELLRMIIKQKLSVRKAEELARNFNREGGIQAPRAIAKEQYGGEIAASLGKFLGAKVTIKKAAKANQLQIEFYSEEELARLYEQIMPDVFKG